MNALLPEKIKELVQVVFAEAEVVSAQLFAGQHTNLNYDLQLANPTTAAALKIYKDVLPDMRQPWKETYLLRMITSETGVPVPRVLHFDDTGSLLPQPWALHTRLSGQPLAQVIDVLDDWELEGVGYEVGRYLGHLHQIPLDEFGELFVPDPCKHPREKAYLLAQTAQWLEVCAQHKLLSPKHRDALARLVEEAECLDRGAACLIHGYYGLDNIIVERGIVDYHVAGVLDFKHARGGSPEQDMSALFVQKLDQSPTFQKGFLDGYVEFGTLGPLFWERVELYQILHRLERMQLYPGTPQEQEYTKWMIALVEK